MKVIFKRFWKKQDIILEMNINDFFSDEAVLKERR